MWFLRLPVNRLLRAITPAKARSPETTLTQLRRMHRIKDLKEAVPSISPEQVKAVTPTAPLALAR
jgi:hypothetical protein